MLCLDYMREFSEYGSLLAWSTLLHDIGKPDTMTVQDRIRFNNHGIHGAKKAAGILRRLKAQRRLIDGVYDVIENHMNFINVKQMRVSKLKRFVARETFEQELALHWIDCMASHGNTENYDFLLEKKQEYDREGLKPDPLIQGRDLISLGLQPGPLFGEILSAVYDLQLEGEIETQKEALDWVVKNYIGTSDKQSNL
ncbi:MAG: HD domain-containing protein [Chitinivibrionales bacterium]